jgi:hypothetical protein
MKLRVALAGIFLAAYSLGCTSGSQTQIGNLTAEDATKRYGTPAHTEKTADGGTLMVWKAGDRGGYRPAYVPPRGPTYGAAAVASRELTPGRIPYGRLEERRQSFTLGFDSSGVLRTWSSERSGARE